MGTNESLRWGGRVMGSARLKYNASRRNIRNSQWTERSVGFAALGLLEPDLNGVLDAPASLGAAVGFYEDRNCEAANAERDKLDADRADYEARCAAYDDLVANIEWPEESIREDLSPELAECEAALLTGEYERDIVLKTRDSLLDWNLTLKERIAATVDVAYLEQIAETIRVAIAKFAGVEQSCKLPQIENTPTWIRKVGCR